MSARNPYEQIGARDTSDPRCLSFGVSRRGQCYNGHQCEPDRDGGEPQRHQYVGGWLQWYGTDTVHM